MTPIYEVLDSINYVRKYFDYPPVDHIETGTPMSSRKCPIARTLNIGVKGHFFSVVPNDPTSLLDPENGYIRRVTADITSSEMLHLRDHPQIRAALNWAFEFDRYNLNADL